MKLGNSLDVAAQALDFYANDPAKAVNALSLLRCHAIENDAPCNKLATMLTGDGPLEPSPMCDEHGEPITDAEISELAQKFSKSQSGSVMAEVGYIEGATKMRTLLSA